MDLKALASTLDEFEKDYRHWRKPIERVISENPNIPTNELRTLIDSHKTLHDPDRALYEFLPQLCREYSTERPSVRAAIRDLVAERRSLPDRMRLYAQHLCSHIHSPIDVPILLDALCAISMENSAQDYRDTLDGLADVYVAAEAAGIDPQPHFEAVAKLSSTERSAGGFTPVAQVFRILAARLRDGG